MQLHAPHGTRRRTRGAYIASSRCATRADLFLLIAEAPQRLYVVRPALAHLYPELDVDLDAVHALERPPGTYPDLLQPLAAGSDQDRLLTLLLDPERRRDVEPA